MIEGQLNEAERRVLTDAVLYLLMMRCNRAEIAAAILPSSVCGFILRLLPRRFANRLSDGR